MTSLRYRLIEGSGNSFVLIDATCQDISLSQKAIETLCTTHKVDGLLLLTSSPIADCRMKYFNRDGREAGMCGNGLRCTAFYLQKECLIETAQGVRAGKSGQNSAAVDMGEPELLKTVTIDSYDFILIDSGVPHAITFVDSVDDVDLKNFAPQYRHNKTFGPHGANVSVAEKIDEARYKIRTFERGVEAETGACGTAACALACALQPTKNIRFTITPSSKQDLYVSVKPIEGKLTMALEGPCHFIGKQYVLTSSL